MTVFRILVYFLCIGLWQGTHSHLYYNGSSGQNPDCQVTDKVDCLEGELEDKIGQERCDFLGCCWEEQPGSPYCFYQGGSCQGNQCVRGQGICKPEESGYTCDCHYPYYGEFCQYSDYNRVCPSNRNQCHNFDVVDFQCDGLGCCWQDNFCFHSDDQPHGPDGFCSEMDSSERQECGYYGIWRDECWGRGCCWYTRDDWEGGPPWCYIPDRCSSNPCQNGGTCHNDEGAYICDCVSPYTGVNCESGPTTEPQPTTVTTTTTTTTEKPTSPAPESTVNIYTTEEHRTTLAKKDTTSEVKHSTFELTTELDVTTVGADATPSLPKVTSSGQTTVGAEFTTVKYSTEPPTTVGLDKITTANDLTTPLNGEEVTTSRAQSTKEMDTTIQESQTSLGDKVTTEAYITTRAKATTESVVRSTDEADTTVGYAETTEGDIATTEVNVTTENVRPTTSQLRLTTEMETTVGYKETTEPHTTLAEDEITTEEHISTKTMETNPSTNRIVTTVEHKETTELGSNEDTTEPDWTTKHVETTSSSVRQTTTIAPVTTEKMQPNLSTVHSSTKITTVVEVDTTVNDAESTQVPSSTHRVKASTAIPLTSAKQTSEAPEQTSLYPEKASTTQYQSTSLPSKMTSSIPEETSGSSSSILPSTTTTPSSGGGVGGFPGELPPPSFPIAAVVAVVIIFAGILPCTIGMVYIIGKMNDKKKKPLRSNRIFPDDLDM